jgi:hypothetical protein
MTPMRARSTSENGLCVSLPRARTGNAHRMGPRVGRLTSSPGLCTTSMSSHLFNTIVEEQLTVVSSFMSAIDMKMITQIILDVTE